MITIHNIARPRAGALACGAALALCLPSASHAQAQFFARQELGEIAIFNAEGTPVELVTSTPIGERPAICPVDAYYVIELPEDISQLVLTDCATGEEQHPVELLDSP